jgi:hypothetical protein
MSRLTLRLPDSLHRRLADAAGREGVSLNQYLVYLLAQGAASPYSVRLLPEEEVRAQQEAFAELLDELGAVSGAELQGRLDEREVVKPEAGLTPNLIERLQARRADR